MSFVPKTISLGLGFGWDEAGIRMYLIISTSVILDLCFTLLQLRQTDFVIRQPGGRLE